MASHVETVPRACDESQNKYDYSEFKSKYNNQLAIFFASQSGNLKKPWTRARISDVILRLKQNRAALESGMRRTSMMYYWCGKYDVITEQGKDHLVLKKNNPDNPTVRVVAIEDYFDVLLKVHEDNGHGGRDKILKIIKNNYYIQKKPIEIFLSLCPTCEMKRTLPKKCLVSKPTVTTEINERVRVDIIEFKSKTGEIYNFLLIYQDVATNFIQLRPLATDRPTEIALELVKIFLIFGAPVVLQSGNGCELADVLKEVSKIWPQCKTTIGGPCDSSSIIELIRNKLANWMRENVSTNWSIGCHIVQFEINSSYYKPIGGTPYCALFGRDVIGPQTSSSPEDVVIQKSICSEDSVTSDCLHDNKDVDHLADESTEEAYECDECNNKFTGFVYECVQCTHRMCGACDALGCHKHHYVLRIPPHSSKSEAELVRAKVRLALAEAAPEPRADSDTDGAEPWEPSVELKMEFEPDECDPLSTLDPRPPDPARASWTQTLINLGDITVKVEPQDMEPSTSGFSVPSVTPSISSLTPSMLQTTTAHSLTSNRLQNLTQASHSTHSDIPASSANILVPHMATLGARDLRDEMKGTASGGGKRLVVDDRTPKRGRTLQRDLKRRV